MLEFLNHAAHIVTGFNTMLFAGATVIIVAGLNSGLKRRKYFWLTFLILAPAFLVLTNYDFSHVVYNYLNQFMGITFALVYIILALLVWLWFDTDLITALFLTICGYTLQHLIACFNVCLNIWMTFPEANYIITLLIDSIILALFFFLVAKRNVGLILRCEHKLLYLVITAITLVVICFLNFMYYLGGAAGMYLYICESILAMTLMLAQYGILRMLNMQREKEITNYLLVISEEQRKRSENNIDIINVKYHDLKRQIQAIKQLGSNSVSEEYIAETEQAIKDYMLISKSGNKTIDTILTEKSFECNSYGISFTSMLKITDENVLNKIDRMDFYIVLSNALDNAIEAVKNIEPEHRIITLEINTFSDFVKIHVDNYCAVPPKMVNGYPVTTKSDQAYHGYGIKSIRLTAQKYNGNAVISFQDNMFCLDIILQTADTRAEETAETVGEPSDNTDKLKKSA